MKKFLLLGLLCISSVFGQTTGTIVEATPFSVTFEHNTLYATKLFRNGVLLKTYTTNEVAVAFTATPPALNVYRINVVGQPKVSGTVFTAVSVDPEGYESDFSPTLTVTVKPKSPGNLKAVAAASP